MVMLEHQINAAISKEEELIYRIKELEAENTRLRQQLGAANAQLDFMIEEMKKAP